MGLFRIAPGAIDSAGVKNLGRRRSCELERGSRGMLDRVDTN